MRALWQLLVVVLGALSVTSAMSAINLLLGGFTAYGTAQLTGASLMAVLMFLLARKALAKAPAA